MQQLGRGVAFLPLESTRLHTGGGRGKEGGTGRVGGPMPHPSELVCSWGLAPPRRRQRSPLAGRCWEAPRSLLLPLLASHTPGGSGQALSLWTQSLLFWSLSPETGPGNPQRNPVSPEITGRCREGRQGGLQGAAGLTLSSRGPGQGLGGLQGRKDFRRVWQ